MANGTAAGIAHLAAVLSAWMYNFFFKFTALSWLPYAVSSGCCPRSCRTAVWAAECTARHRPSP